MVLLLSNCPRSIVGGDGYVPISRRLHVLLIRRGFFHQHGDEFFAVHVGGLGGVVGGDSVA